MSYRCCKKIVSTLKKLTFADELFVVGRLSPLFLLVALATGRALRSASVVLAPAEKFFRLVRVQGVASVGVSVAHAASTDTDILDRVKVLKPNDFIQIQMHYLKKKRVDIGCENSLFWSRWDPAV